MLEHQTGDRCVRVEVSQGIATIQTKPYDDETIVAHVCGDVDEHVAFGTGGEEGHHVAGTHCCIKRFRHAFRG